MKSKDILTNFIATMIAACSCAAVQDERQSAYAVGASIVATRASQNCAEIDMMVHNGGGQDAFLIVSGDAPFVDFIAPRQNTVKPAQEEHVRFSLAERLPAGWPVHRTVPKQIRLGSHHNLVVRIRIPLPLGETLVQAAHYTEHGHPPPLNEFHIVNDIGAPFWVRVNIGVTVGQTNSLTQSEGGRRDMVNEILRKQYLVETQSVRVYPTFADLATCRHGLIFENTK